MREIPPTAGMPLRVGDLLALHGQDRFAVHAAAWLGVPEAGVECSGTAALMVILRALRRRSKARAVIVPAFTCPLVVRAIHACGLRVRLCDVAPGSFELDGHALAALCDADTLAVVPTHLAGRVADVARVAGIARACGAFVIEDAAQAFGARRAGQSVGLIGDAAFFSFAVGKGLTLYEGGLWIARDAALRAQIRQVSGEVPGDALMELCRAAQLLGYWALYRPLPLRIVYGWPLRQALHRGDDIGAAGDRHDGALPFHRMGRWRQRVGARLLGRLRDFQAADRSRALARSAALARIDGIRVLQDGSDASGVWPCLVIHVDSADACRAIVDAAWGAGLGVSRLFARALPAYGLPGVADDAASIPNARAFAARTFTISNSHWLDDARFARIVRIIEDALSRVRVPPPARSAVAG